MGREQEHETFSSLVVVLKINNGHALIGNVYHSSRGNFIGIMFDKNHTDHNFKCIKR